MLSIHSRILIKIVGFNDFVFNVGTHKFQKIIIKIVSI